MAEQEHVDAMLAELSGEGVLARRGEFELDASKAREKMSKFQLQNPLGYVLEFVQTSYLLGAEAIDVEADSDEFQIEWVGHPVSAEQIENLYGAAFSNDPDVMVQALKHLAIGVNAASGIGLSRLVVEGVDGEGQGFRWTQVGEVEQLDMVECASIGQGVEPGFVRVYLKEKLRFSHIGEFFGRLSREVVELELIRDRCRYSPQKITLNGEVFEHELTLPEGCAASKYFERDQVQGVAGFMAESGPCTIEVTQHGVLVGEPQLMMHTFHGHVLVNADHLQKDLSRTAIVEDEAWRALVWEVIPDVLAGLAATFLKGALDYIPGVVRVKPPEGDLWIEDMMGRSIARKLKANNGLDGWGDGFESLYQLARCYPLMLPAHRHPAFDGLCGADMELAHPEALRSMEEVSRVLAAGQHDSIGYSRQGYPELEAEKLVFVEQSSGVQPAWRFEHSPGGVVAMLGELDGYVWKDQTGWLKSQWTRHKNYMVWSERPPIEDFETPEGSDVWLHKSLDKVAYTWSWRAVDSHQPPEITYLKNGRVFCVRMLEHHDVFNGLKLTVQGRYKINALFSEVVLDQNHVNMIAAAAAHFPEFMLGVMEWVLQTRRTFTHRAWLRAYLVELCDGELEKAFLDVLHSRNHGKAQLKRFDRFMRHEHWLLSRKLDTFAIPGQRLELLAGLDHISRIPLFRGLETGTGREELLSLGQLHAMHVEEERLGYVKEDVDMDLIRSLERRRMLLWLEFGEIPAAEVLTSRFVLKDLEASEELEHERAELAFMERKIVQRVTERCDDAIAHREFRVAGAIPCQIVFRPMFDLEEMMGGTSRVEFAPGSELSVKGLSFVGGRPRGALRYTFLYHGRVLDTGVLEYGIGHMEVEIDATEHIAIEPDFSGVKVGTLFRQVIDTAKRLSWEMVRERFDELLGRLAELSDAETLELWGYVERTVHDKTLTGPGFRASEAHFRKAKVFKRRPDFLLDYEQLIACEDHQGRTFYVHKREEVHEDLLPVSGRSAVIEIPSASALPAMKALLGEGCKLVHVAMTSESLQRVEQAKQKFLEQRQLDWQEPAGHGKRTFVWSRTFEIGDRRGSMAMWLDEDPRESVPGVQIELLNQSRRIQTATRLMYLGRFGVRIEADDLDVDPSWGGLTNTASFQALCTEVTNKVRQGFEAELEEVYQRPHLVTSEERAMWFGYMFKLKKTKPRRLDESHIKQLVEALPLFERADGKWCDIEEVTEVTRQHASKLLHIERDRVGTVPEDRRSHVFVLPAEEEGLWRALFSRALLRDVHEVLAKEKAKRKIETQLSDFAKASRRWDKIEEEAEQAEDAMEDVVSRLSLELEQPVENASDRLDMILESVELPEELQKSFEDHVIGELRRRLLEGREANHELIFIQDDLSRHIDFVEAHDVSTIRVEREHIRLPRKHPAVLALEQAPHDAIWWNVLVSAVYSAINTRYVRVTDQHEEQFLEELART